MAILRQVGNVQTTFRQAAQGIRREVRLFQELGRVLTTTVHGAVASQYHEAPNFVTFQSRRGTDRPWPRCELADLLLFVYRSGDSKSVRMTWLQAKVARSTLFSPSGRFGGDIEQWELLSTRPLIYGTNPKFNPPSNILSAALFPSVGSFGIFYPIGGTFDMAYFSADVLRPLNFRVKKRGTIVYSSPGNVRVHDMPGPLVEWEAVYASSLLEFECFIKHGLVGTPVEPLLSVQNSREMRMWFAGLLRHLQQEGDGEDLAGELLHLLELTEIENALEEIPCRSVILLRFGD